MRIRYTAISTRLILALKGDSPAMMAPATSREVERVATFFVSTVARGDEVLLGDIRRVRDHAIYHVAGDLAAIGIADDLHTLPLAQDKFNLTVTLALASCHENLLSAINSLYRYTIAPV